MQDRRRFVAGMLCLSFVAIACTKTEAPATDTAAAAAPAAAPMNHDADAVTIRQADSAWMRHLVNKNVDSLMTWYAPDAVSYGFGAPAIGSDQIKAQYTEMEKSTVSSPRILSNTVKFSEDGSMAYDHGTYTMTMTPPGGKPETSNGAYLNVWKKTDAGWRMLAEMSTPVAPPKM